jgi:colanic acid biosynthesis glycosyl transferase WcaI
MARILLHSLIFSPDCVSTAYLLADLVNELQQLGHDVTVLTTTPHYNVVESEMFRQPLSKASFGIHYSKFGKMPVWHVPMRGRTASPVVRCLSYLGFHVNSLFWACRRKRAFDIIIAPSPPLSIGVVAWLIGKWHRAACIYVVQELYPDFAIHGGLIRSSAVTRILKQLERFVYKKCDAVVTNADRFTRIVASRCISGQKVVTIPNFVDAEFYRPVSRDNSFAREHGLISPFVVMYAGNIGIAQDWDPILHAANRLRDQPIKFVIIGDGTRRDWLVRTIAQRELKNILVLDYQPRDKMPEINASCDAATITMAPEAGRDVFSSKIYTTLACGKPSIVTTERESELAWIIRESKCGSVVPVGDDDAYADAVLEAFRRRDALVDEGLRGRSFVEERYSKKAIGLQYDSLIRSLVC